MNTQFRLSFLGFFLIGWTHLFAQNWLPLADPSYVYNYYDCDSKDIVSLIADSTVENTYYTNPILVNVEDPDILENYVACEYIQWSNTDFKLYDQPHFLQRKIVDQGEGRFQLLDPGNLVIYTKAGLQDSWLYDSIANVSASISAVYQEEVWGVMDSIKTISLSTGDSIKLSKNFGILSFPKGYNQHCYYELFAIEGKGVGRIMPRVSDFYDFEVGDKFEFRGYDRPTDGYNQHTTRQYEITAKSIVNDTLIYDVYGYFFWEDNSGISSFFKLRHLKILLSEPLNAQNYPVNKTDSVYWLYGDCYQSIAGYRLDASGTAYLGTGAFEEFIIADTSRSGLGLHVRGSLHRAYTLSEYYSVRSSLYKEGLGKIAYYSGSDRYYSIDTLVAYRKNGQTVGSFSQSPLPFPDPIPEDSCLGTLFQSLYPNPASSEIGIFTHSESTISYSLFDLHGKSVLAGELTANEVNETIDFVDCRFYKVSIIIPETIARGIYILRYREGKELKIKKIIIER